MTAAEAQERLVCILNNNQFTKADKKAMYLAINAINKQIPSGGWIDTIEILADALGLSIDEYVGHKVVTKHG